MWVKTIFLIVFSFIFTNAFSLTQNQNEEDSEGTEIQLLENNMYVPQVMKLLHSSKKNIRICLNTCNYSGNKKEVSTRFLNEVVLQARRGIDVEFILDAGTGKNKNIKNKNAKEYLYQNGIKVYDGPLNRTMRCNLVIVDEFTSIVGTAVWTEASIEKNEELTLWIESADLSKMLLNRFNMIKKLNPGNPDGQPVKIGK
jgi:phosphatidylserine/phosphatidylglycerophosphate/cardiolipin synthase-like enzyme